VSEDNIPPPRQFANISQQENSEEVLSSLRQTVLEMKNELKNIRSEMRNMRLQIDVKMNTLNSRIDRRATSIINLKDELKELKNQMERVNIQED